MQFSGLQQLLFYCTIALCVHVLGVNAIVGMGCGWVGVGSWIVSMSHSSNN